ncbi:MAG: flagellar hook-length control protein FliK [Gammaproteobacteria bacterium]
MKPTIPLPPAVSVTLARPLATIQSWQVGQVLRAIALTASADGHAQLRIGSRTVQAQISVPVRAGQQLDLQVMKLGPQPVLQLLSAQNSDPVTAAIRRVLPQQTPVGPLLANLEKVATAERSPVPPQMLLRTRALLDGLPRVRGTFTADQLRSAVRASGLFLESRLAAPAPEADALAVDIKANLLRLLAVLRSWPGSKPSADEGVPRPRTPLQGQDRGAPPPESEGAPAGSRPPAGTGGAGTVADSSTPTTAARPAPDANAPPPMRGVNPAPQGPATASLTHLDDPGAIRSVLQRQVEGALAHVQLNQLASVSRPDSPAPQWLVELPLLHDSGRFDIWSLRVSREDGQRQGRGKAGAEAAWSVTLAFDLPALGPVQARVSIGGDRVSTQFWADRPATTALFERHLEDLRRQLRQAGLAVDHLSCRQGLPAPARPATGRALLDESV